MAFGFEADGKNRGNGGVHWWTTVVLGRNCTIARFTYRLAWDERMPGDVNND